MGDRTLTPRLKYGVLHIKRVAFHSNQLGIRGVDVALYDYAHYNETILKNKSFIVSDKNSDLAALKKFKDRFEVFLYENFTECYDYVKQKNIEAIYYQKAGEFEGRLIPSIKNYVHAVFQKKEVHGDSYCYISNWLANKMGLPGRYVPYIVNLPIPNKDYRAKLGISNQQIIVGRHGGIVDFDLPFVHRAIQHLLQIRNDIVFVFMNTAPFCPPHKNIIFIEGTYLLQNKSNYIAMCDYMLHARNHGESFGLAISEFLFHDKPVISWKNGWDQNHIELLGNKGIWYTGFDDLLNILIKLQKSNHKPGYYKELVSEFTPHKVMKRFKELFYDNIIN